MTNGSFIGAVRDFVVKKLESLVDLVHPDVTDAIGKISHELLTVVEEIEARVAACEAQLRGGEQIPPAPTAPTKPTE